MLRKTVLGVVCIAVLAFAAIAPAAAADIPGVGNPSLLEAMQSVKVNFGIIELDCPLAHGNLLAMYDMWKTGGEEAGGGLIGADTQIAKIWVLPICFGGITSTKGQGTGFFSIGYNLGELDIPVLNVLLPEPPTVKAWGGLDTTAHCPRAGVAAVIKSW